mgnify:CR=1 FL=1
MNLIYLFRRDFRLKDNLALHELIKLATQKNNKTPTIYFVFIFTPEQADPEINKYFTKSGFDFMISSLKELSSKIHINFFYGDYIETLESILKHDTNIKYIFFNHDYSNYSYKRDLNIFKLESKYNVEVKAYHDLFIRGKILEKGYKVMNAYVKRILKEIKSDPYKKYPNIESKLNDNSFVKVGKIPFRLKKWHTYFPDVEYQQLQNPKSLVLKYHDIKGVGTRVGPYVKFGLISCRQLYSLDTSESYKREVIIREFFYQCMIFYRGEINSEITRISASKWKSPYYKKGKFVDKPKISSFYNRDGKFLKLPELIQEFISKLIDNNYLHNRERMMLATYLVHNLGINWKKCERFYANNLQDYDYILNQLNWLWVTKVFFHTRPNIMKLKNFHY